MGHIVTAPAVNVRFTDPGTGTLAVATLYQGAAVPDSIEPENRDHLLALGFIADAEQPAQDEPQAPAYDPANGAPAKNGSKADWEAFARHQGATDADLEGKSRDDLVAAYAPQA